MSKIFSSPLRFNPIYKEKIWGGDALREKLGKCAPTNLRIGESWEVSGWGDSKSVVSVGEYTGATLGDLFARNPIALVGPSARGKNSFPLLFKFIDAQENLSIQVHPNTEQARAHGWGERGKTEAWYVVDAVPDAQIALGFNNSDISCEKVVEAVKSNTLESLLNFIPAKRGDTFFIPAGTVHAILGGVLIYEVQEESNTTLRLYDWNRKAPGGSLRELHINDALNIINFEETRPLKPEPITIQKNEFFAYESLCSNSKFVINKYGFIKRGSVALDTIDGFRVLSVTAGGASLQTSGGHIPLNLGQSILVPSRLSEIAIEGEAGTDVLVTTC